MIEKNMNIGVVGVGFLGRGIVACLASYGIRVVAYDHSSKAISAAESYAQHAMEQLVAKADFPNDLPNTWRKHVKYTTDIQELADVDFVIESVAEDIATKNVVYDELEALVKTTTPIATNTSSLPVTSLASQRKHPERFLGMHWAEPAYATSFMELIRGEQTADVVLDAAITLAKSVGKQPALVKKDIPAFIVNRIGYAMFREALHLLESGVADAATIDRSFRNAVGLWATFAGPFRWIDLTGGPALYGRTMSNVFATLNNATEIPTSLRQLVEDNAQGVVNHRGFYNYTDDEAAQWEERFQKTVWQVRRWSQELNLENE
jgi:3-hydroxybutyryl-CoA dehydrogenase